MWGFNAMRAWVRDRRYQLGMVPIDRDNACRHCQLLKIEGFEGVTPGKNVELIPALTMTGTEARPDFPHGDIERQSEEVEAALTAHWSVTPNLTVSGTLNPDFSQVEADALQLDINEPFALFYEEKRPFFSEGADFFRTPMNVVYTRTMRDPSWGLKLSGKEGPHTLGAYVVQDQVTNLLFPSSRQSTGISIAEPSLSTVLRYGDDLGSRLTLGAVLTSRESDQYFNRVFGVDGVDRATDADTLTGHALTSRTRYSHETADEFDQPQGEFDDAAWTLSYTHETRDWCWDARYERIGEDFRADLGFIPQAGHRRADAGLWHWWTANPGRWWSRFRAGTDAVWSEDESGDVLRSDVGLWFQYQGTLHSWLFAEGRNGTEGLAGREFDITEYQLNGGIRPVGSLSFEMRTLFGDQVDYRNARLGRRIRVNRTLGWNVNRHLKMDLDAALERMDAGGEPYYHAAVGQATMAYQFNVRTFVRVILQHVDYDYEAAAGSTAKSVVVPDDVQRLFAQLLFSYKLNPRSVPFIGYSENSVGNQLYDLTQLDRILFVKLGYSLSL